MGKIQPDFRSTVRMRRTVQAVCSCGWESGHWAIHAGGRASKDARAEWHHHMTHDCPNRKRTAEPSAPAVAAPTLH